MTRSTPQPLVFRVAAEDWEFEQIYRLNYNTFVEEIPQHAPSAVKRLVDKFHAENTYLICVAGEKLVAMVAVRGRRPFSLDQKLKNLDGYLPSARRMCELRLFAIQKGFRGGKIMRGMIRLLWLHVVEKGYDLGVMSGTTRQLKLYQHIGFVPFGPLVGTDEALFQPMYITLEAFESVVRRVLDS